MPSQRIFSAKALKLHLEIAVLFVLTRPVLVLLPISGGHVPLNW